MRILPALWALGLLSAATNATAACQWFGTQLECALGGSQLSMGTQTAIEPTYAGTFRPPSFRGSPGLLDNGPLPGWPFRLEVQNIGIDPNLCWKVGNETYCY